IGAANGDEREFPEGDEVELTREPNRHLAFGAGPHLCLGAHLARLELRVGLQEFHRRIPDYEIAPGAEVHYSPGIRQANSLPLVWSVLGSVATAGVAVRSAVAVERLADPLERGPQGPELSGRTLLHQIAADAVDVGGGGGADAM